MTTTKVVIPRTPYAEPEHRPFGGNVSAAHAGTSSGDEMGQLVSKLRPLVSLMYVDTSWCIYIRKSDPVGELANAGYLQYQESIKGLLVRCGVEEHRVIELSADVGMSGRFDTQFRKDLMRLERYILSGKVKNIVIIDIARLFRDSSGMMPTHFANMMHKRDIRVLTADSGEWTIMEMGNDEVRDSFITLAKQAAKYVLKTRDVTNAGKEVAVGLGAWSGAPVPLGWALTPKIRKLNAFGRNATIPSSMFLYEPHAVVKRRIIEIADECPCDWAELQRRVVKAQCFFPPFAEEFPLEDQPHYQLREYMSTRSCMSHAKMLNGTKKPDRYNPHLDFMPSRPMLMNLITEPLTVGVRTYGSGDRSGYQRWILEMRRYEQMDRKPESKIRVYRIPIGGMEHLGILTSDEDIELYWRVYAKWGVYDAQLLRDSNFVEHIPRATNPSVNPGRGRPKGVLGKYLHAWTGLVYCAMHGFDEAGNPLADHRMMFSIPWTSWQCRTDTNHIRDKEGLKVPVCVNIGNHDIMRRCLNAVFHDRAQSVLRHWHEHHARVLEATGRENRGFTLDDHIVELKRLLVGLEEEIQDERDVLKIQVRAWRKEGMSEEIMEREQDALYERLIAAKETARQRAELDIRIHEAKRDNILLDMSRITEVEDFLPMVLERWSTLSGSHQNTVISVLVKRVMVYGTVGTGPRELVLVVHWVDGTSDIIVTWSGFTMDKRPWEDWEDQAILEHFGSDCTVEEMASKLLPYRKFSNLRDHAYKLGVKSPGRTTEWREEYINRDRSWQDANPGLLCFVHFADQPEGEYTELREEAGGVKHVGRSALPEVVLVGVRNIMPEGPGEPHVPSHSLHNNEWMEITAVGTAVKYVGKSEVESQAKVVVNVG